MKKNWIFGIIFMVLFNVVVFLAYRLFGEFETLDFLFRCIGGTFILCKCLDKKENM